MLSALELTGSVVLLESLFPILNEPNHTHSDAIQAALTRYIARVSDERAKEAFEVCFRYAILLLETLIDVFCSMFRNGDHQDELKVMVISRICVPMLHRIFLQKRLLLFLKI